MRISCGYFSRQILAQARAVRCLHLHKLNAHALSLLGVTYHSAGADFPRRNIEDQLDKRACRRGIIHVQENAAEAYSVLARGGAFAWPELRHPTNISRGAQTRG